MADNWWEEDPSTPPITKQGVSGFAQPNLAPGATPTVPKWWEEDKPIVGLNPEKEPYKRPETTVKPLVRMPFLEKYLGNPEESPSPSAVVGNMGQGIPIARSYLPKTPEMEDMAKNWPVATGLSKFSGGAMATAPLAGGAAMAGGGRFIPQILAQSGLGAILGGGDIAAEKGKDVTTADILKHGGIGAGFGAVGPMLGKLVTPSSAKDMAKFTTQREVLHHQELVAEALAQSKVQRAVYGLKAARDSGDAAKIAAAETRLNDAKAKFELGSIESHARQTQNIPHAPYPKWLTEAIDTGTGGLIGHAAGGPVGSLIGAIAGERFGIPSGLGAMQRFSHTTAGQKWLTNQIAQQPSTQAILAALAKGGEMGSDISRDRPE